ncbi:hypothetical protein [Hydrogenophaga flava]|uniref:hypothetical protein n=1 Tax=Hydrogenophaga flava TaxID=65657 RepID=UPI0008264995|nr:hypothetical protein [Hydrogenophaga flava]
MALSAVVCLTLSACTAIEKAGYASDIDKGRAILLLHVKTLQAAGDPLGDYFYALGNSDGWIKDVQGDEAITELFRKAAAKGSVDAKILLALQKAGSEPVPGKLNEGVDPRGNLVAWEAGLAELLPLLQQQCYVRRLVVGSRDLGTDLRPHVTTYAVAGKIWFHFRNGYYRYNSDGTRTLLKDPEREKHWNDLHKRCKVPGDIWLDRLYNK